ncbi:MAG: ribose 5-phosphate isomerase B [Clostridiales bacterium]|nr:ribose 5-phosphate isomerase B [Clostridiales bacterium]
MEKIVIGCDHAAVQMKNNVINHLKSKGYDVIDVGTYSEESCDYPDYAYAAAKKVADGEVEKGILICGTGIGMSIAANKVKGIRCALCDNLFSAEMTRRHNDSNMLSMGARVISNQLALKIVDMFLDTPFEGGRHQRRVDKVMAIEKE